MTKIYVDRESHGTHTRNSTLTAKDSDDKQIIVGSDYPLPTISNGSLRLSEGNLFSVGYVHTTANKLADTSSILISIAFGSGIKAHMEAEGLCNGDAEGYLYEGASVSGGTAMTATALNRDSAQSSYSAALLNPTVSSYGTTLGSYILIGGQGKKASGGSAPGVAFVFKPLTTYLLELKNVSGADQQAEIRLTWYEES